MMLVALRFFATGSFLIVCGELVGVHYSTASRIVYKVSRAIARLSRRFIKMPRTAEEKAEVKRGFFRIARFPRCIGAIDCTHVRIQRPGGDNESELYRNRKMFFSINVQVVCDSQLQVRNIVARWYGSAHDSRIFINSRLGMDLQNGMYGNDVLVGDGGYAVNSFMMTPLRNPQTPAEHLYQESQIRTRNPVERCFGILKRRFPVLASGIRLKTNRVEAVIVATAVLHNMALQQNEPLPLVDENQRQQINFVNNVNAEPVGQIHDQARRVLINNYFRLLLNVH